MLLQFTRVWLVVVINWAVVDALVVALDCLISGGQGKKGNKKIYMFTDAGSPVNDSSLDEIIAGMKAHDIDLRVM